MQGCCCCSYVTQHYREWHVLLINKVTFCHAVDMSDEAVRMRGGESARKRAPWCRHCVMMTSYQSHQPRRQQRRHRLVRGTAATLSDRRNCRRPAAAAKNIQNNTSSVFTCIGALGTPSRTGPLARKYLPGFPYSWSLRRLRQKISSIYCTVICTYPSAAQEQPFTAGLFC